MAELHNDCNKLSNAEKKISITLDKILVIYFLMIMIIVSDWFVPPLEGDEKVPSMPPLEDDYEVKESNLNFRKTNNQIISITSTNKNWK